MRLIPLLAVLVLAAGPAPATMPFVWTPGQIEVVVTVNGTPATFLLDTGAEYSVVSTRVSDALALTRVPQGARSFADGVTLGLGRFALKGQRVMVMPFDGYAARGRTIDGLLGYDVFVRYVVKIDLAQRTLTLWEPADFAPPAVAMAVPLEFAGRLPVVRGRLRVAGARELPVRLMVDTGASQSVILRHPFATAQGLLAHAGRATTVPSLADGTRRIVDVPAEQLTLAALTFDRPEVQAFAEPIGSAASTDTDGLIGNRLLTRFTLYVDYARRKLYFEPVRR